MDISSYVLLSQEQALRRRLDVAANNMANMSTAGFKREQPVFREYLEQGKPDAPVVGRSTSFVLDYGVAHDASLGTFQPTGNPLDVMIEGPGYLAVRDADGTVGYTRAGTLKTLPGGELANASGQLVLGEGGAPIVIPSDQIGQITMASDGTISTPQGILGRLAVTAFDDEGALQPRGDGMLTGQGGRELPAAETRLHSGGVEGSNVQPIVETNSMVEILRAYQTSMNISSSLDDMRQRAIGRLGKVN